MTYSWIDFQVGSLDFTCHLKSSYTFPGYHLILQLENYSVSKRSYLKCQVSDNISHIISCWSQFKGESEREGDIYINIDSQYGWN